MKTLNHVPRDQEQALLRKLYATEDALVSDYDTGVLDDIDHAELPWPVVRISNMIVRVYERQLARAVDYHPR